MLIQKNHNLRSINSRPSSPSVEQAGNGGPKDTFVPSERTGPSITKAVMLGAVVGGGVGFAATAVMGEALGAFSYMGGGGSLGPALAAGAGYCALVGGILAGVHREKLF